MGRPSRAGRRLSSSLLLLCLGCGAPAESGLRALLRIDHPQGAQFYPGPLPEDAGGPAVTGLLIEQSLVRPGEEGKPVGGSLAPGAAAAALALDGDRGYWVVVAGVPDVTAPREPTFHAAASFSPAIPPGPHDLLAWAVDADGRAGAPRTQRLELVDAQPGGELVITLGWDTAADLDLHVITPTGAEIWARQPVEAPGPQGGALDRDANGGCVQSGGRTERVRWETAPPPGRYLVRVDAASLCGAPFANWVVTARLRSATRGEAWGHSDEAATRGDHGRGAGLLALSLDVP